MHAPTLIDPRADAGRPRAGAAAVASLTVAILGSHAGAYAYRLLARELIARGDAA